MALSVVNTALVVASVKKAERKKDIHDLVHTKLRFENCESFKNFLRMNDHMKLLNLVKNSISKQETIMKQSISATKR